MSQIPDQIETRPSWSLRCGRWGQRLTLLAVLVGGTALLLARYDAIAKLAGFAGFVGGGLIAAIGALLILVGLIGAWRRRRPIGFQTLAAAMVACVYAGFILTRPLAAGNVPPLHDISTDLAAPPQFEKLALRSDNLAGVETVENWKRLHAATYGDLKSVEVSGSVAAVTERSSNIANDLGWTVHLVDPAKGHIEATDAVSFIRFYDDVAIRITPADGGRTSRVDVRSVSRIGISDFGVNARRIRTFLKALTAR